MLSIVLWRSIFASNGKSFRFVPFTIHQVSQCNETHQKHVSARIIQYVLLCMKQGANKCIYIIHACVFCTRSYRNLSDVSRQRIRWNIKSLNAVMGLIFMLASFLLCKKRDKEYTHLHEHVAVPVPVPIITPYNQTYEAHCL